MERHHHHPQPDRTGNYIYRKVERENKESTNFRTPPV